MARGGSTLEQHMFQAIRDRNEATVRDLLNKRCSPNCRDSTCTPALFLAVEKRRIGCVRALLEHGAKVDSPRQDGMTAFMCASLNGLTDFLRVLRRYKANINAVDSSGVNALMLAVRWGKLECLQYLIEKNADINVHDKLGRTAVMDACIHNKLDCLRYLLYNGADISKADQKDGYTALIHALTSRSFECANVLLDWSSKELVNKVGKDQKTTALTIALRNSKDCGQYSFVERLLQRGACVSSSDEEYQYLHRMIVRDEKQIVRLMVINGCLPYDRKCWEYHFPFSHPHEHISPLAVALLSGHYDTARYFLVIKFLTKFDVTVLPNDQVIRQKIAGQGNDSAEALAILDALRRQPMSLRVLDCITLTESKNTADNSTTRQRIENSGLPPSLQRELLFQTPAAKLCTRFWHDITLQTMNRVENCFCESCDGTGGTRPAN